MRFWLENMVWHHRFSQTEIHEATGMSEEEISSALRQFRITPENRPKRKSGAPLQVLPYPGGRHPRIGFLNGAVDPQRETKFSVFTPWDESSFVVVDVPEAIWSNLGLTYLAHTHVPTIWSKQSISLPRMEWNRREDGSLDFERTLPNGIAFGTQVRPGVEGVRMELWLRNGTGETLRDLRVQNCLMLKGAPGFNAQTNENKVLVKPYAACRSEDGKRWIITAWEPCDRMWANPPVPCMHSDPKFPDCPPGEARRLRGWLSFYEGADIEAELRRLDSVAWRQRTNSSEVLNRFFDPPAELSGNFGKYPSLLALESGAPVRTAEQWRERRAEIRRTWEAAMGTWPPLLTQPRLEFLSTNRRENFTQHRVRVPIAEGQGAEGWLLVPDGAGPFPAVLVPYYEPETSIGLGREGLRDFGLQLARRGFVTLSIGSPGGDARKPVLGTAQCQPLSFLAHVAANGRNALAALPRVDGKRIGIVGHSYGGKWAMFAACLDEGFACGVWSDPGIVFDEARPNVNYWEPWYLGADPRQQRTPGMLTPANPRTGAYKKLVEYGHDLHEILALMAPRPFLVSGGSEDTVERWQALNRVAEVYTLLRAPKGVAITLRPSHSPTEESNEQACLFLERYLKLPGQN